MDELDDYVGQILDLSPGDLTPMETPSATVSPVARRRTNRLAPLTALAAMVLLAMVLSVTMRIGGHTSPHRTLVASLPSRAASFVDVPADAGRSAPLAAPSDNDRTAPATRADGGVRRAQAASTQEKARPSAEKAKSRSIQLARVAPSRPHSRAYARPPIGLSTEDDGAAEPTQLQMISTATNDRLDAIDAIRLLRQR